mmetsp:Transcript_101612/g.294048  ORF Transcript_101612/g.294048 Transcript_101612/m.294048 type:complete len:237 (-) Transcript_101612:1493-2203(-)
MCKDLLPHTSILGSALGALGGPAEPAPRNHLAPRPWLELHGHVEAGAEILRTITLLLFVVPWVVVFDELVPIGSQPVHRGALQRRPPRVGCVVQQVVLLALHNGAASPQRRPRSGGRGIGRGVHSHGARDGDAVPGRGLVEPRDADQGALPLAPEPPHILLGGGTPPIRRGLAPQLRSSPLRFRRFLPWLPPPELGQELLLHLLGPFRRSGELHPILWHTLQAIAVELHRYGAREV